MARGPLAVGGGNKVAAAGGPVMVAAAAASGDGGGRVVHGQRRPELRGWVDSVFGEEWGRIKRMSLPPQRSVRTAAAGPGGRNNARRIFSRK